MAQKLLSFGILSLVIVLTTASKFEYNSSIPRKHGITKRSSFVNYTNVFHFWQKHKNEFVLNGIQSKVVLVMGNTGSGKTTLTSALSGRQLNVIRPPEQSYFVIVDEEKKIGTGISSQTLIPEIMIDNKTNVMYIDSSGFRDNRDIKYEISSLYFQHILMSQIKKLKFVFVVNYESVKLNGNKNDFDDLIQHIGEFIKNISKFHDGMALVVTKVENIYEYFEDGTRSLMNDDQSVLNSIAGYLTRKKEIYYQKISEDVKYRMYINMIDTFLQKKNNSFTRIAIFRQPTQRGPLQRIPSLTRQIDAIAKLISENLQYIEKNVDDFGFALSTSAKNTVDQIVDDIFRNDLMDRLLKMGNETLLYYRQIENQFNDITILRDQFLHAYNNISSIQNVGEPLELFQKFLKITNVLQIPVSLTDFNSISESINQLYFFTTISNSYKDLHMLLLKDGTQNVTYLIQNSKSFYEFLNNLQLKLATYHSQTLKDDNRIKSIISYTYRTNDAVRNIPYLENIMHEIGSEKAYEAIKTMHLNQVQLKHLKDVFEAFTTKLEFLCTSSPDQLIVKGYNIRMSDIIQTNCWAKAKIIQIFALNKIFIDCSIDKTGAEVQLFIIAPTWETVGGPKIILDGKPGEPHRQAEAKSSSTYYHNGADGLPGLPGGPAGDFYGVGRKFINVEHLEIHANGGKGGPGQRGGNGGDGSDGSELPQSLFNNYYYIRNVRRYLDDIGFTYTCVVIDQAHSTLVGGALLVSEAKYKFHVPGKPAIPPSAGGDGGSGGKGGYPGRIVIDCMGNAISIATFASLGALGSEGQGGHGGKGARDGRSVTFSHYKREVSIFESDPGPYYNIQWANGAKNSDGMNGKSGHNQSGQRFPTKLTRTELGPIINSFQNFLKIKLEGNIKEVELREFMNDNVINAERNIGVMHNLIE